MSRPIRAIPRRQPGARAVPPALAGGRWSLLDAPDPQDFEPDELAEAIATQLLSRWGVVFRDLVTQETLAPPWRDLLQVLRRMEARGEIRGGRFVSGFVGEQFARPEAVDLLRAVRRSGVSGEEAISTADPLNLSGILLPGLRINPLSGGAIPLPPAPAGTLSSSAKNSMLGITHNATRAPSGQLRGGRFTIGE